MNVLRGFKGKALTPTVWKLGLVSFFADISSEMLYPITPMFLTLVLGASVAHIGVIEGFAEGLASLLKTYSGYWSDKLRKRRSFIWIGYLFAALSKPLIGAASSWVGVFFARSMDRFGKGIRTAPRDALLAESVEPQFRGAAFGWHRMMDSLGAALGPLLAILFLQATTNVENLRWLYFLALIPGMISVLVVFSISERTESSLAEVQPKAKFDFRQIPSDFKTFLLGWGVFSLANSSDVFLLLKAQKSGLTLTMTILLYAFYNLLYSLSSPFLGHLSDRFGKKWVLISGLLIYMLVYLGFGSAIAVWHFWLLFGVYGLYMAATDGVGKALAVALVPKDFKATGLGMLGTVTGIATIAASSVAGLVWDRFGSQWSFYLGALGALLAILVLLKLPSRSGSR